MVVLYAQIDDQGKTVYLKPQVVGIKVLTIIWLRSKYLFCRVLCSQTLTLFK